jgi:rhamnulokinase
MPATSTSPLRCLVFDLGAGSGRAILAGFDGRTLRWEEVFRFAATAVDRTDGPHWDVEALKQLVEEGIRRTVQRAGSIDSIGIDSWGLDYALLDAEGRIIGEPFHYRHPRSHRGRLSFPMNTQDIFECNGIQDLPVNTIYQLFDDTRHRPDAVAHASALLMIADVLNHHLTGALRSESTLARTSGLIDIRTGGWNFGLCRAQGLPAHLLQPLIQPGEMYGHVRPSLGPKTGAAEVPVFAVAAHDTASAVAALPLRPGSAFLIAGSWFLVGIERQSARLDDRVLHTGFGNESGADGRTALLKSLPGFHLMHKLRVSWRHHTGVDIPFPEIAALGRAAHAEGRLTEIDLADPAFFNPGDIVMEIGDYCGRRKLDMVSDIGRMALAIYAGLVRQVGQALASLRQELGYSIDTLIIGGGGAQDATLQHLLRQELSFDIVTGPVEASAWGNALFQLIGLGAIASLDEGRRVVQRSLIDS